jgi:hypothetical protein
VSARGLAVCKMASVPQLPTFTLAIYVGLVAGLVVLAVALVMLRVYGYRNRLSTVTTSASYDADAELADVNSGALIATTLSVMGSPLPDFPDEQVSTRKTSVLSSLGSSRWEQVKGFVAGIRKRGSSAWSALRRRLAARRAASRSKVELATPCSNHLKSPATPNTAEYAGQLSNKCQLGLFHSPTSSDIGMI